jgi:hypothetical protein
VANIEHARSISVRLGDEHAAFAIEGERHRIRQQRLTGPEVRFESGGNLRAAESLLSRGGRIGRRGVGLALVGFERAGGLVLGDAFGFDRTDRGSEGERQQQGQMAETHAAKRWCKVDSRQRRKAARNARKQRFPRLWWHDLGLADEIPVGFSNTRSRGAAMQVSRRKAKAAPHLRECGFRGGAFPFMLCDGGSLHGPFYPVTQPQTTHLLWTKQK